MQLLMCSKRHPLTETVDILGQILSKSEAVVQQQLTSAKESGLIVLLDSRLANLETRIGEVTVYSNLLCQSNGNQDRLCVSWLSATCIEGVLDGCKECLNFPFYCLFHSHNTAFFAFLLKCSENHHCLRGWKERSLTVDFLSFF